MIDPAIAAHSGRLVKLMGDGALVEFASAVDAVTCAIEIQRQLREHDAGGSEVDPIRFRIGINVGDIISRARISLATASTSRRGSKASPNLAAFRSPKTHGGKCKARWRSISSMPVSTA